MWNEVEQQLEKVQAYNLESLTSNWIDLPRGRGPGVIQRKQKPGAVPNWHCRVYTALTVRCPPLTLCCPEKQVYILISTGKHGRQAGVWGSDSEPHSEIGLWDPKQMPIVYKG